MGDTGTMSPDFDAFLRRASTRAQGFAHSDFAEKPFVGIVSNWSELSRCHMHFKGLTEAVARGVWQAGGFPREIPTMPIAADMASPTGISFMHRNLLAMQIEEIGRVYPVDALVLVGSCDETLPAMMMAAASLNLPTIILPGGPGMNGRFRGADVGSSTDCHRCFADWRAGELSDVDMEELEGSIDRGFGHCTTMGTASTMACLSEVLGLAIPGSASIPATDSRRVAASQGVGRLVVRLARHGGPLPRDILTRGAFENAVKVLGALAGSTNAVMHLLALAGRCDVPLNLQDFDPLWRGVPVLADLKPTGRYLMDDFYLAGGVPALLRQMVDVLDRRQVNVTGSDIGQVVDNARVHDESVVRSMSNAVFEPEALVVLKGSLAPDGALLKQSSCSPSLRQHAGRAVVFESHHDLVTRIDDPSLKIDESDVLVLRNAGPRGAPGMPEWGSMPLPKRLLRRGIRDMVRVSDSRMSGTAFGTTILHVSPEAYNDGPLALVRTGDGIALDVPSRALDLLVPEDEMSRRRQSYVRVAGPRLTGYPALYRQFVTQANHGCDFRTFDEGGEPS